MNFRPFNARVTNVDGSYWVYSYDAMGQVTSGKKYWGDNTPVVGQQFDYGFDDIGNRQTTTRDTRQASYSVNSLNQYTSRDVPGFVNVLGTASNAATVTLWGDNGAFSSTTRKGDYYRGELRATNSSTALWLGVTNLAVLNNGSNPDLMTNATGKTFIPRTPETFYYDWDGNLTNDGRWTYTWDAENRLIRMVANTAVGPQQRIDFDYDWRGRRTSKRVWNNTAGSGLPSIALTFLYDEWNLLAELAPLAGNALVRSYAWGLDLSGTQQGAGGVGGLLLSRLASASQTNYCTYDGNGNVANLINAANGGISATYEYGPFGELIRATGAIAKDHPIRFSTKYQDEETDLIYYGYRYYSVPYGRWLNRDPIGELGFELVRSDGGDSRLRQEEGNLYLFVSNDGLNKFDYLGLNPNIAPGTKFTVKLQGGGKVTVTVGSKFSQAEQDTGRRGLCLVRKLLGYPPYLPPFSDTYWATFTGTSIDGLTYDGSIFISSSPKPTPCNFVSVANFGALLAHEADHYYTGSDDGPGGPGDRINTPVLDALRKALSEAICGCCKGQWQLENLLGKYACDCGLTPCKPKPCPKPQ